MRPMQRWLVELNGEHADIEEFPKRFPDGDVYAVAENGKVYLTGPAFDQFSEGQSVRNHAMGVVDEMSAVIAMLWAPFRKPQVGSVVREDGCGGRSAWAFPQGVVARAKLGAIQAQVLQHGQALPAGPTHAQQLLTASRTTEYLHAATLLWVPTDPTWGQLYRIVEELTQHLGMTPAKARLCSKNELKRFKRTANSADASGLGARHRTGKGEPPKNPMTLEEAATFVKGLLESALGRAVAIA